MLILAADTSLPLLTVALLRDGALLGSVALEGKGSRNEKLLPAIDWLLRESAVDRASIDLFASTRGPGSFTGVRIGVATLQGLALVLGKPLCAMSTHEAARWAGGFPAGRVVVTDDAGRGEFYATLFEGAEVIDGPRLVNASQRAGLAESAEEMNLAAATQSFNVAVGCARRAGDLANSGRLAEWSDITPLYVRLAEAEVKLQQAVADAARP